MMTVGRLMKGFFNKEMSMANLVHRASDTAFCSFAVCRGSSIDIQRLLNIGNLWPSHASWSPHLLAAAGQQQASAAATFQMARTRRDEFMKTPASRLKVIHKECQVKRSLKTRAACAVCAYTNPAPSILYDIARFSIQMATTFLDPSIKFHCAVKPTHDEF